MVPSLRMSGLGRRPASVGSNACVSKAGDRQIHVRVLDAEGLPSPCILSLRFGSVRRQAAASALLESAVKFPLPVLELPSEPLKVTAMKQVGTALLVLHPHRQRYRLELTGNSEAHPISMDLSFRGHALQAGACLEERALQERHGAAGADAGEYLAQHRLLHYVQALLHSLVQERPEDPFEFIASQLRAVLMDDKAAAAEMAERALPEKPAKSFDVTIDRMEGIPEGSMVSVRVGTERRQMLASRLLHDVLRFPVQSTEQGKEPVKFQILLPVASKKVCLLAGEDRYTAVLSDGAGRPMTLKLQVSGLPGMEVDATAAGTARTSQRGGDGSIAGNHTEARAYLERHGLLRYVEWMIQMLVEQKPQDPLGLLSQLVETTSAERAANDPGGTLPLEQELPRAQEAQGATTRSKVVERLRQEARASASAREAEQPQSNRRTDGVEQPACAAE